MQKIIQHLPFIVIIAAIGIITYQVVEHRHDKAEKEAGSKTVMAEKLPAEKLPVADNLSEKDRTFVRKVFESPEKLDTSAVEPASSGNVAPPPSKTVTRLSEMESEPLKVVTDGSQDRYFQEDFKSMRTEAIRNPDSPENRAMIGTLMQKRQQRLAQEKR